MRRPPSFLLQSKLNSLVASFPNYWFHDFDATRFQNFKKFLDIFVILVSFETLSYYPYIDSFNFFRENAQRIEDKVFR